MMSQMRGVKLLYIVGDHHFTDKKRSKTSKVG